MIKGALIIIIIVYCLALLFIFLYSLAQAHLVYCYLKNRKIKNTNTIAQKSYSLPHVTVQLPVYNEMYVVERLIDAVCSFN